MKKRYSAKLIRIGDLLKAEEVVSTNPITDEESRYIVLSKQVLRRVRICGTVVGKREGISSGSSTRYLIADIDDGSGVISIFIFGMINLQEEVDVGSVLDVVGRPRQYNDQISLTVETLKAVDVGFEIYQRVKLLEEDVSTVGLNAEPQLPQYVTLDEFLKTRNQEKEVMGVSNQVVEDTDVIANQTESSTLNSSPSSNDSNTNGASSITNSSGDFSDAVLKLITENPDGITIDQIVEKLNIEREQLQKVLDFLVNDFMIIRSGTETYKPI